MDTCGVDIQLQRELTCIAFVNWTRQCYPQIFIQQGIQLVPYECSFIMQQNVFLKDFVVDKKVDLLGITETWLHMEGSQVTIAELCPNGHPLLHTAR